MKRKSVRFGVGNRTDFCYAERGGDVFLDSLTGKRNTNLTDNGYAGPNLNAP